MGNLDFTKIWVTWGESWAFMMSLDSPPTPIKVELYYYFIAVYKSGKVSQSE